MQTMAQNVLYSPVDDNSETDENNFTPLSTEMPTQQSMAQQSKTLLQKEQPTPIINDNAETIEGFSNLSSNFMDDYYKQHAPYYNNSQDINENAAISNAELLKKLNNILHILEEQTEERTNYITEELILYIFLGVFVIFVIDSFIKVGKYVR